MQHNFDNPVPSRPTIPEDLPLLFFKQNLSFFSFFFFISENFVPRLECTTNSWVKKLLRLHLPTLLHLQPLEPSNFCHPRWMVPAILLLLLLLSSRSRYRSRFDHYCGDFVTCRTGPSIGSMFDSPLTSWFRESRDLNENEPRCHRSENNGGRNI